MREDRNLGFLVHDYLKEKGVETPFFPHQNVMMPYKDAIAGAFEEVLTQFNLDLADDSLKDTPRRIAEMYMFELFIGLDYNNFPKCTTVQNKMQYGEMITIKNIQSISVCEHHFQTIDGVCKVSYIPKDKILGLSKFNRVVDFFSRRPQIQERLTNQIYYALNLILQTEDIAVQIDAVHYCVKARGIKDCNSSTTTTKLGGRFLLPEVRNEFLNS